MTQTTPKTTRIENKRFDAIRDLETAQEYLRDAADDLDHAIRALKEFDADLADPKDVKAARDAAYAAAAHAEEAYEHTACATGTAEQARDSAL